MTIYTIIFYLLACIIIISTGFAITRKNPVHAIVYLVLSFFATALLFYLLGAPLPAALEIIIYAGAIMVLFLFIVMIVPMKKDSGPDDSRRGRMVPLFLGSITLILGIILIISDSMSGSGLKTAIASPSAFGHYLFKKYWLSVEIISLLLFVSLVGALSLSRKPDELKKNGSGHETEYLSDQQSEKREFIP